LVFLRQKEKHLILKPKLLYFYPNKATFVKKDIAILSENYNVKTQDLAWIQKSLLVANFISQLLFILKNSYKTSTFVVMFGGYWSFLPALLGKVLGKRVFIILGGTDCVSFPEFNYGSLRKQPLKWFVKKSYQWCTRLLPVDNSLIYSDYNYLPQVINKQQGVKAFFKNLQTPYTVIPNGFDMSFWQVNKERVKSKSFVSTAFVSDNTRLRLKGFDTILKLAHRFKGARFTLIGLSDTIKETLEIPENVTVYNNLTSNKIKKIYVSHQFYLQLSLSEGFPNALAEAMLCQCIPIGTAVGGIPKIISTFGVVVQEENTESLFDEIQNILALPQTALKIKGQEARAHIVSNFELDRRAALLNKIISRA
jgi:glycosyltransferase involved in cell wall biosynthesis